MERLRNYVQRYLVADNYLGPSTSDVATWGNRGNTTVGTALSASEKYLQETSKTLKVVKPAGKVIIVVGFIFMAQAVASALAEVHAASAGLRVLGSYPRAEPIEPTPAASG